MGARHCSDCGHRASQRARFCERCGAALTATAEPLRAPSALEARILSEGAAIAGERKQVTVVYTDIVGSMQLTHLLDDERWGLVLDRFLAVAAEAVHRFEGTVNQFTGDGLMAVFGAPLAHEDHARRACLAVLELQQRVAALAAEVAEADDAEFAIRCGLNSGEVVVGAIADDVHMAFVPIGITTSLGKRIEALAPVGSAALSASTAALVEGEFVVHELGEFEVKGAQERQRVFELVGPAPAPRGRFAAVAATRGLSPFVGRDAETTALGEALGRATAGHGRAVGIVGDAGVGKSRLVHEFSAACAARGAFVSSTTCVAHGHEVPFLPMLALYRRVFRISDRDRPEVARERIEQAVLALDDASHADVPLLFDFLGVSDPARSDESLGPAERLERLRAHAMHAIRARSRRQAAVLVIEDVHWIDEASAALLDAIVAAAVDTRTLVILTYRPEHEPGWRAQAPHTELRLGPLDPVATDALLTELLGDDESLNGVATRIESRTGGNPFFIEETIQALAEDGHLVGDRTAYRLTAPLEELALPPTVQAGLAARIDRLPVPAKALLQQMSVVGTTVPAALLREVSPVGDAALAETLDVLTSAHMLLAHDAPEGPAYAFKHPLTRDVAYASQLSRPRARAHAEVADAMERAHPQGLDERAALLAQHREAAGEPLAAARWHARAAEWAASTSLAAGMRHWQRVRELTGDLDASPERTALAGRARLGILSMAWRLGLPPEEAATVHAETQADVERLVADLYYAGTLMHGGRERDGLKGFRGVLAGARAARDAGVVLTAATGVAYGAWIAGSLHEAKQAIDSALASAADDPRVGAGLVFACPLAQAHGDRGRCLGYSGAADAARAAFDLAVDLAREHDDPQTECAAHANRAHLESDLGAYEAALHHAALGRALAERSGNLVHVIACDVPAIAAAARLGRAAGTVADAGAVLATVREHRVGLYCEPLLLATIARCHLAEGDLARARAAAEEAVAIMTSRGLRTCALQAPIALADVLRATEDDAALTRIDAVLGRALDIARTSGAPLFESLIRPETALSTS